VEFLISIAQLGGVGGWDAGDIIDYHPDGHGWSQRELTHPLWRIVSVDVLQTTADALMGQTTSARGVQQRIRDWRIDVSLLPDPSLFQGPRTQAIISLTRKQCTDAIVQK